MFKRNDDSVNQRTKSQKITTYRVKLTLPKGCGNIVVAASTSGKCTKQHVRLYHKEIYSKCIPTDSVLIEDAWAGHIDISVAEDALPEDYNVDIRILPKGSTNRVKLTLPKGCGNIVVAASTSGKCTKQHVRLYHKEIYSKCIPTDSVLIEDAWAGHIDISVAEDALPEDYNVDIRILPKGSTSIAQPLDVFFFRQLKEFLRKVIELALLIGTDVKFFQRNELSSSYSH
ncbi:hypothetical protein B566_EDAN002913 [Ephemera danica]|nr:hypothetical protein B566_EDAN002913 [Ephemera danica]